MFDPNHIEALLQSLAGAGKAISYSALLNQIGLPFSRPKMRALCVVLDEIDRRGFAAGQPELAVLVVRESDRLPGQGWWIGRRDYDGRWTGPGAQCYVAAVQQRAFDYWRGEFGLNISAKDVKFASSTGTPVFIGS